MRDDVAEAQLTKGPYVDDLRPGQHITGFFVVKHKQLEPFRDRSRCEYLTLTLADKTGQIVGRVWGDAPAVAEMVERGSVVKVAADVEEYGGRLQLIVHRVRAAREDEVVWAEYLPATERDTEVMLAYVRAHAANLREPNLAQLVSHFFDDPAFVEALRQAPVTRRVHHAYLGGVLEQMFEMLTLTETVQALFPAIHIDLLRAGILLRAPGMVAELTWKPDVDYTDAGRLLGHIVLGDEAIAAQIARQDGFPAELALRVRHMLISHRGRLEWGSPRTPQTLEAIALHHLEALTSEINHFEGVLASRRDLNQPWTSYNRLLGRPLFAGYEGESEPNDPGAQPQ